MSYRSIVVLASIVLMAIFAGVAFFGGRLAEERMQDALRSEASRLKTAYELSQGELEQQMMALAGIMAADPETVRLMRAANEAVAAEGGGAGGAVAANVRDRLHSHLGAHWAYLQRELGVRQMQFVLPGTISFLRFHAPASYGDELIGVRWLLRDVAERRASLGGFETGRAYAGIRGAAPVFDSVADGAGERRLLGVMEVGIAFDGYIQRLSERTEVGFGVLLEPKAVTSAMWENYRPPSAEAQDCCYLLAASRPELSAWMANRQLPEYRGSFRHDLVPEAGRSFLLIRFPLFDYPGRSQPERGPIGSVVIWQDVSDVVGATQAFKRQAMLNLALAYAVTQLLLLALVRASHREWRNQLAEQTARVGQLLHQNELLLMAAGEGLFGVDAEGRLSFINPAALRMLSYSRDELVGQSLHALVHGVHADGSLYPESACPVMRTLEDGTPRSAEEYLFRRDGSRIPVQMTVTPICENGVCGGAVVAFHDISEIKEKEEVLTQMARTDALTGLCNRRHFIELLDAEIRRWQRTGQPAALLMVDLDFFKRVNDTWGHAVGDEVLRHFAKVLRHSLRRIDIPGRIGGEEFAVILPDSTMDDALAAAERLRANVESSSATTACGEVAVTVSIGVSLFNAGDVSNDAPLRRADEALYRAKMAGRNRVEGQLQD